MMQQNLPVYFNDNFETGIIIDAKIDQNTYSCKFQDRNGFRQAIKTFIIFPFFHIFHCRLSWSKWTLASLLVSMIICSPNVFRKLAVARSIGSTAFFRTENKLRTWTKLIIFLNQYFYRFDYLPRLMPPNVAVKPGNERHDEPVSENRCFHEN